MIPAHVEVTDAARAALEQLGRVVERHVERASGGAEGVRMLRVRGVHADDAPGAAGAIAQALGQDVTDLVAVQPSIWTA